MITGILHRKYVNINFFRVHICKGDIVTLFLVLFLVGIFILDMIMLMITQGQ